MAKKKTEDDGKKKKKKGSKQKIIALVVIALVGYKFFLAPKPAAKADNAPKKEGAVVPLPELTLNLAGSDKTYLRIGIALVFWEGKGGGGGEGGKGDDKEASIASDVAVSVLSSKSYTQLKENAGKEEAKKEITEQLNHALDDSIARILFTSFVMQ